MRSNRFLNEHIRPFLDELLATLRRSPVELFLALFEAVYGCLFVVEIIDAEGWVLLAPGFALAYALNRLLPRGGWRIAYYLTPLLLMVWLASETTDSWVEQPWLITLLALSPIFILLARCRIPNEGFVSDALHCMRNLALAYLVAWLAFGLAWAICSSVIYIFNFASDPLANLVACLACLLFGGVLPTVWLTLDGRQQAQFAPWRFVDTLVNWIVTPALLIYAVVLYCYFLKIAIMWELPRGGVAWMVFGFVIVATAAKAYLSVAGRRSAAWFYDRFHWICLPALLMFWIGVGRRIADYGLTEARIYLLVCGVVMSWTALMFFWRRMASYWYAMAGGATLFVLLVVPGISAEDLAERWGREEGGPLSRHEWITLNSDEREQGIDLSDYAELYNMQYMYEIQYGRYGYNTRGDSLRVFAPDGTIAVRLSLEELLARQLERIGLPADSLLGREALRAHRDELLVYHDQRLALLFGSMSFQADTTLELDDVSLNVILIKRDNNQ